MKVGADGRKELLLLRLPKDLRESHHIEKGSHAMIAPTGAKKRRSSEFEYARIDRNSNSQLHDRVPRAHIDARPACGAFLLIDHGDLLDELDCAFRTVLLADSASDASELADLFYATLACRAMSGPRRPDNVPSGSDREYMDWLNLSAMDDTDYTT